MSWNNHRIRPSKNSECPVGRPDVLFFTNDNDNLLNKNISSEDVLISRRYCKSDSLFGCQQECAELALTYMNEEGLHMPKDYSEAEHLYMYLTHRMDH